MAGKPTKNKTVKKKAVKAKKAATVKAAKPRIPMKGDNDDPPPAPIGHNYRVDKKKAKAHFDDLDRLHKEKAETNAGYMADINNVYEKAATALGIPEKIIKKEYKKHKALKAIENDRANLESDERDMLDSLDLALGSFKNTPLGRAAIEQQELAAAAGDDGEEPESEEERPEPDDGF